MQTQHELLIDVKNNKLRDNSTNVSIQGKFKPTAAGLELKSLSDSSAYLKLMQEFPDLLDHSSIRKVAKKHDVKHRIITNCQPIFSKARRLNPEKLKIAKAEFDKMLELGICRPSESPWASPLHIAPKPKGGWRPCGDYRRLNAHTLPDRYPVSHIHDFNHFLNNTSIYSKIDVLRAFNQIPVSEEDIQMTALITPFGLFEFPSMTFGLCNAAETFQRFVNTIIQGLDFCFAYIDEILIASKNEKEHLEHVYIVLQRLNDYGMVINVDKCSFGKPEIEFMGYQINKDGTKPVQSKVTAIKDFKRPETVEQLKRFLGMLNYYRRFIPHAAETQIPLLECTRGNKKKDNTPIDWTPERIKAFDNSKSQFAIGGVVNQLNNNMWEPLACFSRRLSPAELNYSTYDRELVSIYASIKHFQNILEAREFTIFTDHKPLVFAFHQKNEKATPRQLRHLDFIGQFSTDIQHISGKDNIVADALSRISTINSVTFSSSIDFDLISKQQENDPELKKLQRFRSGAKFLRIDFHGKRLTCDVSKTPPRLYIPTQSRKLVFEHFHKFSHSGAKATASLIKRSFTWPAIDRDVRIFCKSCIPCQKTKIHKHNSAAFESIQSPSERFEHVHIDLVGSLPSSDGYTYVLTCIDRFTRWPEAIPLSDIKAETVAKAFYLNWISRFGCPIRLTSDQGRQFESDLFMELNKLLGTQKLRTTAFHPQANGMIERCTIHLKILLNATLTVVGRKPYQQSC